MSNELDQALAARKRALDAGVIDTDAIELLERLLPASDPRHPFHGAFMAGRKYAAAKERAVLEALGVPSHALGYLEQGGK